MNILVIEDIQLLPFLIDYPILAMVRLIGCILYFFHKVKSIWVPGLLILVSYFT
jgi:hypothetical protein